MKRITFAALVVAAVLATIASADTRRGRTERPGEEAYEYLPSVNFILDGQASFTIPPS